MSAQRGTTSGGQALTCAAERAGLACSAAVGSFTDALARTLLDPVAEALVNVRQYSKAPQHVRGHPVEQVADDVVHQPLTGRVVEHLTDHRPS